VLSGSVAPAFSPISVSTLGAPAAALGLIEGIADGCAGVARLGGGALADDPDHRRRAAPRSAATPRPLSSPR
jgi:hypothetical protein